MPHVLGFQWCYQVIIKQALLSGLCSIALSGCSPCDNEKGAEVVSPNHQLTATVVHVGCGAMAKDATWITLHRTGEKFDRSDDLVFTTVQQQRLEIAWADDSHLLVTCHCRDDDIRFQVTKRSGITISYR